MAVHLRGLTVTQLSRLLSDSRYHLTPYIFYLTYCPDHIFSDIQSSKRCGDGWVLYGMYVWLMYVCGIYLYIDMHPCVCITSASCVCVEPGGNVRCLL